MKERCKLPDGISICPDGVHELSPHRFKLKEVHRNVTVNIYRCVRCGAIELLWDSQPDSEHEYIDGKLKDEEIEPPDDCLFQIEHVYKNATVEVLECEDCGYVSVWWKPQPDTEEIEI